MLQRLLLNLKINKEGREERLEGGKQVNKIQSFLQ